MGDVAFCFLIWLIGALTVVFCIDQGFTSWKCTAYSEWVQGETEQTRECVQYSKKGE